jgi:3',5'-cyclic AMP phosphodiesterase CpdA
MEPPSGSPDTLVPTAFDSGHRESVAPPEADARSDAAGDAFGDLKPFTIVVLPDTQFYARHYSHIFDAQTKWIVEQKDALNIAFVLHLGDIVDLNLPTEWMNASKSMAALDGKVPYVLAIGNHDIQLGQRFGMINAFFPVSRFAGQPWFRGTYEPNDMHNSWALFDVGGQEWIALSLEFGPRDGALDWADNILKQHPRTPAIVVTHAYLHKDGTRYDHKNAATQLHNPHTPEYGLDKLPGGVNDGEEMWQKLISKNANVRFVLSGHDVFGAYARLTSTRGDGSRAHQILSNYQFYFTCPPVDLPRSCPNLGGNGWLRVMEFAPAERRVRVRTYSPYLMRAWDDPMSAADNEFELDL